MHSIPFKLLSLCNFLKIVVNPWQIPFQRTHPSKFTEQFSSSEVYHSSCMYVNTYKSNNTYIEYSTYPFFAVAQPWLSDFRTLTLSHPEPLSMRTQRCQVTLSVTYLTLHAAGTLLFALAYWTQTCFPSKNEGKRSSRNAPSSLLPLSHRLTCMIPSL